LDFGSVSNMASIFNYFVEYDVPFKDETTKKVRALDWTKNRHNMYDNTTIDDELILDVMNTQLSNTSEESIKRKWQNTLSFYNQFHR
jgi:hypothetical protein